MTPEQRIDAALDSVLKASGSALRHYTMPKTLADMREAMRKAMFDEYNAARMLEALKAAAQFVETEQFPIGWSVDRIREVIAKVSGMTPNVERNRPVGGLPPEGPVDGPVGPREEE